MEYTSIWSVNLHGVSSHSVISIWIEIWICIQSADIHGMWRHSTLLNIYIDTDKDINMECAAIWSGETLHNM